MDDIVAAREVFDAKVARWLRTKSGKSVSNHSLGKKNPNFIRLVTENAKVSRDRRMDGGVRLVSLPNTASRVQRICVVR